MPATSHECCGATQPSRSRVFGFLQSHDCVVRKLLGTKELGSKIEPPTDRRAEGGWGQFFTTMLTPELDVLPTELKASDTTA
jgi:hypothetical protein